MSAETYQQLSLPRISCTNPHTCPCSPNIPGPLELEIGLFRPRLSCQFLVGSEHFELDDVAALRHLRALEFGCFYPVNCWALCFCSVVFAERNTLIIRIRDWARRGRSFFCTLLFAKFGCSHLLKFRIFLAEQFNTLCCRVTKHRQCMFGPFTASY